MTAVHEPIVACGQILVTRRMLAALTNRHPDVIRDNCRPIACQSRRSRTKAPVMLYDMDESAAILAAKGRRQR